MPTPNFKLLLHALRLGQPPEATSAIRALAEEIASQEEQLEDLRSKLAVMGSHLQFVEARAARLEASPQAHDPYASPAAPAVSPRSAPPPSSAAAALEAYEASLAALAPHPPAGSHAASAAAQHSGAQHAAAPHGASPHAPHPQASHPASVPPPAAHAAAPAERVAARAQPISLLDPEESSLDGEYKAETLVVNRRDIEALRGQEAPFRLPPPGARVSPEARRSIPGAPWAKGGRGGPADARSLQEDYTVDMPGGRDDLDDSDDSDDTFRDRGATSHDHGGSSSDPNAPRRR